MPALIAVIRTPLVAGAILGCTLAPAAAQDPEPSQQVVPSQEIVPSQEVIPSQEIIPSQEVIPSQETAVSQEVPSAEDGAAPAAGQAAREASDPLGPVHRVAGTLREVTELSLFDGQQRYYIARIQTEEDRTARVLLGPVDQLAPLEVQDGRSVEVRGFSGTINNRGMLVATWVRSGGEEVEIEVPQRVRPLMRITGELVGLRQVRFRGAESEYLVGQLRAGEDVTHTVNLGPAELLEKLDLRRGGPIALLAYPTRINGEPALVAERIRAGSQTLVIPSQQRPAPDTGAASADETTGDGETGESGSSE